MAVKFFLDFFETNKMDSPLVDYRGAVAAAQAFVTAVRKKDGTSLKN